MKTPFEHISGKINKFGFIFFTIGFYSFATVCAKIASGYPFLSGKFILYYGLELGILFIYAVLWQQILKKLPLSVAYAFRSLAIFWVLLWSIVIFHDILTLQKLAAVIIVFAGTMVVSCYE